MTYRRFMLIITAVLILALVKFSSTALAREDDDEPEQSEQSEIVERQADRDEQEEAEKEEEEDEEEDENINEAIEESDDSADDEPEAAGTVMPPVVIPDAAPVVPAPTDSVPVPSQSAVPATEVTSGAVEVVQPSVPVIQTKTKVISVAFPWAWVVTRTAGIASFIALTVMAVIGMLLTTGLLYRIMSPSTAWSIHRAIGTTLLLSVAVHLAGLLLDSFIRLRVVDVFVPFVSPYQPTLVALGIGGFYLLLLILATSLYTMTSHAKFWRTIHTLAFPMYALLFLHGLLIGTDRHLPWVIALYWVSGSLVGLALVYRLVWKYRTAQKPAGSLDFSSRK